MRAGDGHAAYVGVGGDLRGMAFGVEDVDLGGGWWRHYAFLISFYYLFFKKKDSQIRFFEVIDMEDAP